VRVTELLKQRNQGPIRSSPMSKTEIQWRIIAEYVTETLGIGNVPKGIQHSIGDTIVSLSEASISGTPVGLEPFREKSE